MDGLDCGLASKGVVKVDRCLVCSSKSCRQSEAEPIFFDDISHGLPSRLRVLHPPLSGLQIPDHRFRAPEERRLNGSSFWGVWKLHVIGGSSAY